MRLSTEIIEDIKRFEPIDENWLRLDTLLNELWNTGDQEKYASDLLAIFERFPKEDGDGVFWSIIHGVESFASYETSLVESLNRQPSEMGLLMLKRIKNLGKTSIDGIQINNLVNRLLSREALTPNLKQVLLKIVA